MNHEWRSGVTRLAVCRKTPQEDKMNHQRFIRRGRAQAVSSLRWGSLISTLKHCYPFIQLCKVFSCNISTSEGQAFLIPSTVHARAFQDRRKLGPGFGVVMTYSRLASRNPQRTRSLPGRRDSPRRWSLPYCCGRSPPGTLRDPPLAQCNMNRPGTGTGCSRRFPYRVLHGLLKI